MSDLAAATGNLDFGGHKGVNVADPGADQDTATKKYHDDNKYTDAEVDAIVAIHTAISAAHHTKYTDAEARTALENSNPSFATGKFSNLNSGEIVFPDSTHKLIGDSDLFWDIANKRLAIGTNTPAQDFEVKNPGSCVSTAVKCDSDKNAYLFVGYNVMSGGRYGYLGYFGPTFDCGGANPDVCGQNRTVFQGSGGGFVVSAYAGGFIRFCTGNLSRLEIDSSGNIGVWIKTPTAKFDVNSDIVRLRTPKTPATAGASGNAGDICWDANYVYVCVATNTWKRSGLATW